jgi:MFS family permease
MSTPPLTTAERGAAPAEQKKTTTATGTAIASAVGAAVGAALVRSLPPSAAARVLGGLTMGLLVGLVPWFVGRHKGQERLGKQALIWSAIAGSAFGLLLAGPLALGFTAVIQRRSE